MKNFVLQSPHPHFKCSKATSSATILYKVHREYSHHHRKIFWTALGQTKIEKVIYVISQFVSNEAKMKIQDF